MKSIKYHLILLVIPLFLISCEDFLEVKPPDSKLVGKEVFSSDATAISAMEGIYNELFQSAFSNGYSSSVTVLSGLSADRIHNINTGNDSRMQFEQNEILPDNTNNLYIWASAYNIIYMTNALLEGLENSNEITPDLSLQLEGEARFIRAFTYFYLVNLYGDVPLILTTDYNVNRLASRIPISEVQDNIIEDLGFSVDVLNPEYRDGERTHVNKFAAIALLARVYLYLEDWEKAEMMSTKVIEEASMYGLTDLNEVFLANSKEAIWQISPIGGGGYASNTYEGNFFIIHPIFSFLAAVKLDENFVENFHANDGRLLNWIGYNEAKQAHFAYKYKIWSSTEFPIEEYSMVLRLAELYLIRAEARAEKGDIAGSMQDLDTIRDRAGIDLIADTQPEITQDDLLMEILAERSKELFAEWGHRWLDLKRTGKAQEVLGSNNPYWESTDVLYPIPEEERKKNPNLSQNPGY
ncbi:RagB/SusD family nutrient uptake outer membrane protein [Christiangramia fulva]|uniref:RagB/SusD family nutrient uptake outer membrane protein n=1 Tax=Christiangramia fulva TaxID=2126553 RepID=A0A2R3ZAL8_9FLAO|nr:RagB/SusD family nutrient uptake outer membrane protein [Christiangramia fulva]AVR47301.1 RagB/SusD family nutrient uptake outer membrane protein [Christiangramia fulva]